MSCELDVSDLAINRGQQVTFQEAGKALLEADHAIGKHLEANVQTRIVERLTLEGIELVEQKIV